MGRPRSRQPPLRWPLPSAGWWIDINSTLDQPPGTPLSTRKCSPPEACRSLTPPDVLLVASGDTCKDGYTDAACSKCEDGYFRLDMTCRRYSLGLRA